MNAAAAIYVSGKVQSYADGVAVARDALDRGAGLVALERLKAAYGGS
jgi:anthranilate phosphoribosyltransferase